MSLRGFLGWGQPGLTLSGWAFLVRDGLAEPEVVPAWEGPQERELVPRTARLAAA